MTKTQRQSKIKLQLVHTKDRVTAAGKTLIHRTKAFIQKRPMTTFFVVLGLLLLILIIGKATRPVPQEKTEQKVAKSISVFNIGEEPQAIFQAKVKKAGVVTIVAQSAGIVQSVSAKEGDGVGQGQTVISLASNYQGGNAAAVQSQIAKTQYQNVLDTFGLQKDALQNQREVATNSAETAQKTREISRTSLDETGHLITDNQNQLDAMRTQLTNTTDPKERQALSSAIGQLQSGIYQLNAAQRTGAYQSATDTAPAKLTELQKELALKQLDIQDKGLALNQEVSRLQTNLAAINEATMYPASPFAGTVEKVFVKVGQSVTPGTPLATVASADTTTTAELNVPENIARAISLGKESTIVIKGEKVAVKPYYVSSEATDGSLYSVYFEIPKEYQRPLSDGEFVQVTVPIETPKTASFEPLIPIDSVYQTQEKAYVLVNNHGKAATKTLELGSVYGSYVEVQSGLTSDDEIILDRNVVADDKVTARK